MGNQQGSPLKEVFKVYEEFPKYEVSNLGNIRNVVSKKPKYVHEHSTGYILVQFKKNGKAYTRKMHRIVAELFVEIPEGRSKDSLVVKHLDNDKSNNVYTNLKWDTHLNNMRDAYRDGLISARVGSLNGRAKLTEDIVRSICEDYEKGMRPVEAREKYKTSKQQAEKIHSGRSWTHISKDYKLKNLKREPSTTIPERE